MIQTVQDLINELSKYNPSLPIRGAWEGQFLQRIIVFDNHQEGVINLDVDKGEAEDFYNRHFVKEK